MMYQTLSQTFVFQVKTVANLKKTYLAFILSSNRHFCGAPGRQITTQEKLILALHQFWQGLGFCRMLVVSNMKTTETATKIANF